MQQGIPFRDAYLQISQSISKGEYNPLKNIHHTHEGSIGNLCNNKIIEKFEKIFKGFAFDQVNKKILELLTY